ncbi:MAG TPA: TerC family protein [Vicinamibacteria bacterium]|nr:TerC family protein [Vicinamibacteria bacterium]
METIGTPALWAGFTTFVLAMLALDLGVFHRKAHRVGLREALAWSVVWVTLALAFGAGLWHFYGEQRGLEYLTGYLIEKALAVDNIFVFVVLFSAFAVPAAYQHRVLFWGILGALAMRAVFIVLGAALIQRFHWVLYLFGAILLVTGVKLLARPGDTPQPERNPLFRLFRRLVPSVGEYHGERFTVVKDGRRYATPLLLVLAAIEASDLVFAVDSIPAIFAVTQDPFIVYTSNIFAVLGLRAMYFLLADVVTRFEHLKTGLALVLVFVGAKLLVADLYAVPTLASLAVVATLIAGSVVVSLLRPGESAGTSAGAARS